MEVSFTRRVHTRLIQVTVTPRFRLHNGFIHMTVSSQRFQVHDGFMTATFTRCLRDGFVSHDGYTSISFTRRFHDNFIYTTVSFSFWFRLRRGLRHGFIFMTVTQRFYISDGYATV